MKWQVFQLQPSDRRLEEVIDIWGLNRNTLGLFPRGAFEDCVSQGRLAVALATSGTVAGYIAFRVQRRLNAAVLIHLCVRENDRGTGVADALADWLKAHARERRLTSLRLKCRRDYRVESLWQRLGFVARGDVAGRGRNAERLTIWVHSLGGEDQDLFELASQQDDEAKLTAVLDANIFFDLHGEDSATDNESKVLLEPWIDDAVKLFVVNELHNEINRHDDDGKRDIYHRFADCYPEVRYDATEAEALVALIDEALEKSAETKSERSDRKQLARSAASGADVFLTRDQELLDAADALEMKLRLRVMSPSDLASRLDETEHAAAYQPARLSATTFTHCGLRADDVENVVNRVQLTHLGEKPSQLTETIRRSLTKVRSDAHAELNVVRDPSGEIAALTVATSPTASEDSTIILLRVCRGSMDRTLIRQLLLHAIQNNVARRRARLIVTEQFVTSIVMDALLELGFENGSQGWIRHTPALLGDRHSLTTILLQRGMATDMLEKVDAAELEARFWPAKVLNEDIPTFVVPINSTWAAQLYDSNLAAGELFGALAHLALNRENVYYRSAKNAGLSAPGRILWYVKKNIGLDGTMAIRACSRLLSVEVNAAKTLFSKYRRLGVYDWREVLITSKDDPYGQIMALRFADTEQFASPVEMSTVRDLGIKSMFQSPTRISEEQFAHIYRLGTMPAST